VDEQNRQDQEQDRQDVAASLNGDGQAYERLIRRHQQMIAKRMWRFSRDRRELEELVEDVFVEAYRSLASFRSEAPLSHWLGTIATRVGFRFWKRRRRRAEHETPLQDWDAPVEGDPAPLEAAEAGRQLQNLLGRLPPRDRLVLTLLYWEEMSVAQAAEQTGWSESMVKVQAHRARKKLRRWLEKQPEKADNTQGEPA
jgi:RNA polymerase sigma factor (sigma-70 family)